MYGSVMRRAADLLPPNLAHNLGLIRVLAFAQLRERYLGTWAGMIWAFAHPIILIATYWVVFAQAFKMPTIGERPFLLVLICGLVPWMVLVDAIIGASGSVVSRAYLVRKISFPIEVLPITHVVTALMVHIPLLVVTLILLIATGHAPGPQIAWLPYYLLALTLFSTGAGLLFSALCVAFRDVQQALNIVTNILFWATPIVWSADMLPPNYRWLVDYNPLFYLIEGYRYALLGASAPPSVGHAQVFWLTCLVLGALGIWTFRRLKPSFGDIL